MSKFQRLNFEKEHSFWPLKRLGQNFLINEDIIKQIVLNSNLPDSSNVLEIGSGTGNLSKEIIKSNHKLLAVEVDKMACQYFENNFIINDNLKLVHGDILKLNLNLEFDFFKNEKQVYLIANIPYYLSGKIVDLFLKNNRINFASLMLQKELAERIVAKKNTKEYSSFSVFCQTFCIAETLLRVPRKNFTPTPKVDSQVIKLTKLKNILINPSDYDKFLKRLFSSRRKSIKNNLKIFYPNSFSSVLAKLKIEEISRAESLDVSQIVEIYQLIKNEN